MRRDEIRVVPYDPSWPASFEAHRVPLERALAPALVLPIAHIGSTAVPGLGAKPIIDMLAVVVDIGLVDQRAVVESDWVLAPEPDDDAERRLSFCRPTVERRTHHLHVVEESFGGWREWVAFRDHLRTDPEVLRRYEELKRDLASSFGSDPNDRTDYRRGKTAFIMSTLARHQGQGPRPSG